MAPPDPPPDSKPDQTRDEANEPDTTEPQPPGMRGRLPISRRNALASLVGLGSIGLLSGSAQAGHRGPHWRTDVDADGNTLLNLGALAMTATPTPITDFEGKNLDIDGGGILNAQDTRTNVSRDGTEVVANTTDINFSSNFQVSADAGDAATVDLAETDDSLLQKGGSITLSEAQPIPDDFPTSVDFDKIIDDDRNEFDPDRGEFVCAHAGDYVAHAQVRFHNLHNGALYRTILLGGGEFGAEAFHEMENTGSSDHSGQTQHVQRTFKGLTPGDRIKVRVEHHGGDHVELLPDEWQTFLEVRQVA